MILDPNSARSGREALSLSQPKSGTTPVRFAEADVRGELMESVRHL